MRKKVGIIKRVSCLGLIFLLSINSFAAIVSDNDGSAFITKSEFDALKSSFQAQIDTYNASIDSKIDGAIASYLSGITLATSEDLLPNYLNTMQSYVFAKNSVGLTYLAPLTFNHVAISDRNGCSETDAARNGTFTMQLVSKQLYGIGQFDDKGKLNGIVYRYMDEENGFVALKGTSAPTDEGNSPGRFYSNHSNKTGGNWTVINQYLGNGCLNWLADDIEAYGDQTWSINDNRGMGSIQSSCILTRTCEPIGLLWATREYPNSMTVLGYPRSSRSSTSYLGHFESQNNSNYGSGTTAYSNYHKWVETPSSLYNTYVKSYWTKPATWNLSIRSNTSVTWLDYYVGVLEKLQWDSSTSKYKAATDTKTYSSTTSFFDYYTNEEFDRIKGKLKVDSGILPIFKVNKAGKLDITISGIKKFSSWDGQTSSIKTASLPAGSKMYISFSMVDSEVNLGQKTNLNKLLQCNGHTYDANGYFEYTEGSNLSCQISNPGWVSIGLKCIDSSSNDVPIVISNSGSSITCKLTYDN